ncbi:MAG TPA: hypothetical protein VMJ52_08490 [Xanthobacteraceae bacterium]|nr:hypothetical protein [Xanthobacteraceae bacterium]
MGRAEALIRSLFAGIGVLAGGLAAPALGIEAPHGEVAITCTNLSSGASWQIKVDYDHATVDANPARISDAEIKWRDVKDGFYYTLDRKSGNLTVVLASATGGNFLYDRCKLEN